MSPNYFPRKKSGPSWGYLSAQIEKIWLQMGMFVSIWGLWMLRLKASGPGSLFDELLPDGVGELPADLAALDLLLADPVLLEPITARGRAEVQQTGRSVLGDGRPTIAM